MSTPLVRAVWGSHYNAVMLLLQHGAKPNIGDNITNKTLIHIATDANRSDIVKLLLDYGADPNATTCCYNSTILCRYRHRHDSDMVRFIESHGGKSYTVLESNIKNPCIICMNKMWTGRYNRHLEDNSYSDSDDCCYDDYD
jgi:ankyrin repeat protein